MEYSIGTNLETEEIKINQHGDKIYISAGDSALFDRFVNCFDFIIKESKENESKIFEIENKHEGKDGVEDEIEMIVEMSRVNVGFSNKAVEQIDGIFGEGTVRKYFRDHYEKIPSFLPGVDCFMEFLEQISPVMEKIFERTVKNRELASKARMAKYQPQDHEKPQSKDVK